MDHNFQTNKSITVSFTMTEEEFAKLVGGLGNTSLTSRIDAGMRQDQAKAFTEFFNHLDSIADCSGICYEHEIN